MTTKDRNGALVRVGTKVRVLSIKPSVLARLCNEDAANVKSMQGEVLEVYEIDEWGSAWVRKVWDVGEGRSQSHSLALAPDEMELVG